MKATITAVICLVLFTLCACAGQTRITATPSPTSIPAPTPTTPPTPTGASLPGPVLTTVPSGANSDARGDIDLALQVQSLPVIAGAENTYTLTLRNLGPGTATGIVLTSGRQESAVDCDLGDWRGNDAVTITLDLSVGGTEALITGTQLAGLDWNLSAPTCVRDAGVGRVVCYAPRLASGEGLSLRVGVYQAMRMGEE